MYQISETGKIVEIYVCNDLCVGSVYILFIKNEINVIISFIMHPT